jgi:acetaldehyde dehydrogenase/alcohol dehydrogenase
VLLERYLFGVGDGTPCAGERLNAAVVGRSAAWIAEAARFEVPADNSVRHCQV